MAVTFPENLHPSKKLKIKFDFAPRALQYLRFFGLLKTEKYLPDNEANPFIYSFSGIEFQSYREIDKYLRENKIIYDEVEVNNYCEIVKEFTVVDCQRISELFEDQTTDIIKHKLYSINELCELLSFSRPVVYKLIKDGKLKSMRINDKLRVKHRDYLEFINQSE